MGVAARTAWRNLCEFQTTRLALYRCINEQHPICAACCFCELWRQLLCGNDLNVIAHYFTSKLRSELPADGVVGTQTIANANNKNPRHAVRGRPGPLLLHKLLIARGFRQLPGPGRVTGCGSLRHRRGRTSSPPELPQGARNSAPGVPLWTNCHIRYILIPTWTPPRSNSPWSA